MNARLLTSDGDMVEVTHESLFRVWPEVDTWLDEGREFLLWKKAIKDEIDEWLNHDRSPLYLLSGGRAAEAHRWIASHADDLIDPEAEFLIASVNEERKKQLRLKIFAGVVSGLLVLAITLGIVALSQREKAIAQTQVAENQTKKAKKEKDEADEARKSANMSKYLAEQRTRVAESLRLAAQSTVSLPRHPQLAILLAVEAVRATGGGTKTTIEAEQALRDALKSASGETLSSNTMAWSITFCADG